MGRSGTSAITRMFASAGFFAGHDRDLLPAAESNPTGHWENVGVWQANERTLQRLGGSWFDPPSTSLQLAISPQTVPVLRAELQRLVETACDRPIVLKDPRIGVMMPIWGPLLESHLHPVLAIRDPLEIALSLNHRDGTPRVLGLAAWELHMTSLLGHLNGRRVTVAPYADLLADDTLAVSVVEAAATHIGPSRRSRLRPQDAPKAFERSLHHNRASSNHHREYLTARQLDLWRLLGSLPAGDTTIDAPRALQRPSTAARMAVRSETLRAANNLALAQQTRELELERKQAQRLTDTLAVQRERTDCLSLQLRTADDRTEAAERTRGLVESELTSLQSTASWRLTSPARTLRALLRTIRVPTLSRFKLRG